MHNLVAIAELAERAKQQGRPVTESYLRRLCRDKRIPGAFKVGTTWAVPAPYAERWLRDWIGRTWGAAGDEAEDKRGGAG